MVGKIKVIGLVSHHFNGLSEIQWRSFTLNEVLRCLNMYKLLSLKQPDKCFHLTLHSKGQLCQQFDPGTIQKPDNSNDLHKRSLHWVVLTLKQMLVSKRSKNNSFQNRKGVKLKK